MRIVIINVFEMIYTQKIVLPTTKTKIKDIIFSNKNNPRFFIKIPPTND